MRSVERQANIKSYIYGLWVTSVVYKHVLFIIISFLFFKGSW